jgi:hypothetical protein
LRGEFYNSSLIANPCKSYDSAFRPLKAAYEQEVDKWLVTNPGQPATQMTVYTLLQAAYSITTAKKAEWCFSLTEIQLKNLDVFLGEDFAPSE